VQQPFEKNPKNMCEQKITFTALKKGAGRKGKKEAWVCVG